MERSSQGEAKLWLPGPIKVHNFSCHGSRRVKPQRNRKFKAKHGPEVGNFPGRALSFAVRRGGGEPRVLSYPSKSETCMH